MKPVLVTRPNGQNRCCPRALSSRHLASFVVVPCLCSLFSCGRDEFAKLHGIVLVTVTGGSDHVRHHGSGPGAIADTQRDGAAIRTPNFRRPTAMSAPRPRIRHSATISTEHLEYIRRLLAGRGPGGGREGPVAGDHGAQVEPLGCTIKRLVPVASASWSSARTVTAHV